MRIDAHQHYWQIDRGDYTWLAADDVSAIRRDFLPSELTPELKHSGIDATILVQCAETQAETQFLLALAQKTPSIAGVVGWVDFTAQNVAEHIQQLAENEYLVGLRPMLQDLPDDDWILNRVNPDAFAAMTELDLKFDALIFPRHLSVLHEFLDRYPKLGVVIDHCAKPQIAAGQFEQWAKDLRLIADTSNAHCKISGLVTEAGVDWSSENLRPYVDLVLEAFGPSRLMWGSDWPVLNLASSYREWYGVAQMLTTGLTEADLADVFGGVAARFYGIGA